MSRTKLQRLNLCSDESGREITQASTQPTGTWELGSANGGVHFHLKAKQFVEILPFKS